MGGLVGGGGAKRGAVEGGAILFGGPGGLGVPGRNGETGGETGFAGRELAGGPRLVGGLGIIDRVSLFGAEGNDGNGGLLVFSDGFRVVPTAGPAMILLLPNPALTTLKYCLTAGSKLVK